MRHCAGNDAGERIVATNDDCGLGAMSEKRKSPRHRVLKAGTISFGGAGISCTIRNLSDDGAALDVTSPIGIPPEFVLVIEADNATRQCRVVWRKERRIGVIFAR
jgi:hypothetical protein